MSMTKTKKNTVSSQISRCYTELDKVNTTISELADDVCCGTISPRNAATKLEKIESKINVILTRLMDAEDAAQTNGDDNND